MCALLARVLLPGRLVQGFLSEFNGLPVIDSSAKVIGIVLAVDILRAMRQDTTRTNEMYS
jgi:CBS domain-containing protein